MPSVYVKKPKYKTVKCVSCDNTASVGIKTRKPYRCFECGIEMAIAAQLQMRQKSGPIYDKWLARMIEWAAMQGTTTPPPSLENSPSRDDT